MATPITCWGALGAALVGMASGCVTTDAIAPAATGALKPADSSGSLVPPEGLRSTDASASICPDHDLAMFFSRLVPSSGAGSTATSEPTPRADDSRASARPEPEFPERTASEALDSLGAAYPLHRERRGTVITLSSDELMRPGQWALTVSDRFRLDALARVLREQHGHTIVVQGYTDANGEAAANDALSLRRAEVIRDYFVTSGVPAGSITAIGLGGRKPVAGNRTAEGRAQNRRIEIVIDVAQAKASP